MRSYLAMYLAFFELCNYFLTYIPPGAGSYAAPFGDTVGDGLREMPGDNVGAYLGLIGVRSLSLSLMIYT